MFSLTSPPHLSLLIIREKVKAHWDRHASHFVEPLLSDAEKAVCLWLSVPPLHKYLGRLFGPAYCHCSEIPIRGFAQPPSVPMLYRVLKSISRTEHGGRLDFEVGLRVVA